MDKVVILIVGLFLIPLVLMAQKVEVPLTIKNTTPIKTHEFVFTVGAHPQGTDGVDTAIGEVEIPNIPLPGNIFYVWTVAPGPDNIWLSPREYRQFKINEHFRVDYALNVNWSGGTLEMVWPSSLPVGIDSMWITDGYSDFPENFLAVKVEPGGKLVTSNPSITKFKVLVWYNGLVSDVEDNQQLATNRHIWSSASISLWPHPVANDVTVSVPANVNTVIVTDLTGKELLHISSNTQSFSQSSTSDSGADRRASEHVNLLLNLRDVGPGMYILSVTNNQGRSTQVPFIHE